MPKEFKVSGLKFKVGRFSFRLLRPSSVFSRLTSHVSRLAFFTFHLSLFTCLFSCNSPYTQKPTGYFKIDFPAKKYQVFNQPGYPYTFEYPVYGKVIKDSVFFDSSAENPWWVNVDFPQFSSRIYLTYKVIGDKNNSLGKLLNDSYNLTNKHSVRADYINDSSIEMPGGVNGMFFKVDGNVATANQFYLTDSTKHFIRGALYFDATPNQDSLRPVNDFLVQDMRHLISTFKWK